MKKAPYSLTEANSICNEFQYLVGQPFGQDNDAPIGYIAVAPFDQINKNKFIIYFLLCNDLEFALNHEYKGLLFDVIVIAGVQSDQQFLQEDLYSWLNKNKQLPAVGSSVVSDEASRVK